MEWPAHPPLEGVGVCHQWEKPGQRKNSTACICLDKQ